MSEEMSVTPELRVLSDISFSSLNTRKLETYMESRRHEHPELSTLPIEQQYEAVGIANNGDPTLLALLLFGEHPQEWFPNLCIIATLAYGTDIDENNLADAWFYETKRIEGTLPDMLKGAISFVHRNMRVAIKIDPHTGERIDKPQYPLESVRNAVLNALIYRDYSPQADSIPVCLTMFSDRLEVSNPGSATPFLRNPVLVTAMQTLCKDQTQFFDTLVRRFPPFETQKSNPIIEKTSTKHKVIFRSADTPER